MFLRYVLCLIVGLIVGVRITDFWNYIKLQHFYGDYKHLLMNSDESHHANKNVVIGNFLFNDIRILCWIMTTPENHLKRALHVKNTWGSRCNKLIFMSTENDRFIETVRLSVPEGRAFLWEKTRTAFRYVYDHHFNDADWFMKADDDTYVIMENLRIFLYQFSTDSPVYFGCKFNAFVEQGYMSGGAGYVLSKEALRRFAEIAYTNNTICSQDRRSEDIQMGICLQNIGVIAGDSRDEDGQERFIPLAPIHLIPIDTSNWYAKYLFYTPKKKLRCCSRSAISFHYTKPKEFYTLEYFLYGLRSFGKDNNKLPTKANMTELLRKWGREISNNTIF